MLHGVKKDTDWISLMIPLSYLDHELLIHVHYTRLSTDANSTSILFWVKSYQCRTHKTNEKIKRVVTPVENITCWQEIKHTTGLTVGWQQNSCTRSRCLLPLGWICSNTNVYGQEKANNTNIYYKWVMHWCNLYKEKHNYKN